MQKFTIRKKKSIKAPKASVWRVLLTPEIFANWASAFCPGSQMKGNWKIGGFVSYTDKTGMGIKGKVTELDPKSRVTVQYVTVLANFKEAPDKEKGWQGCKETYTLVEKNGVTSLSIVSEVPTKKYYSILSKSWDKALTCIKSLAEGKSATTATQIFVNLPVKDVSKSKTFFTKLGFKIDPQFTDAKAACIVISDSIFAMILDRKFFSTFTKKEICNSTKHTEAIIALRAENREAVDAMAHAAVAAGGKIHREAEDHGWMYGHSFEDLDGHLWEIIYMDKSQMPSAMKKKRKK